MGQLLENRNDLLEAMVAAEGRYLLVTQTRETAEAMLEDLARTLTDRLQDETRIRIQMRPYPRLVLEDRPVELLATGNERIDRAVRGRMFDGMLLLDADESLREQLLPYLTPKEAT